MKTILFGVLCGLLIGCNESSPPKSQPTTTTANRPVTAEPTTPAEPVDRTNTGVNARDRDGTTKTPLDQSENKKDIEITTNIRKRVIAEKLSVDAQNVKIITQDGKVTLRGPVQNASEKDAIAKIAADVAGADHVENNLEVK